MSGWTLLFIFFLTTFIIFLGKNGEYVSDVGDITKSYLKFLGEGMIWFGKAIKRGGN